MSEADRTIEITGLITLRSNGESEDVLFAGDAEDPLAEYLNNKIDGKNVSVRYWITDKPCTREEANEDIVKTLMGSADCAYMARYSDVTGYLWTDEGINIGGHDLLKELNAFVGKYLILEIDIHAMEGL